MYSNERGKYSVDKSKNNSTSLFHGKLYIINSVKLDKNFLYALNIIAQTKAVQKYLKKTKNDCNILLLDENTYNGLVSRMSNNPLDLISYGITYTVSNSSSKYIAVREKYNAVNPHIKFGYPHYLATLIHELCHYFYWELNIKSNLHNDIAYGRLLKESIFIDIVSDLNSYTNAVNYINWYSKNELFSLPNQKNDRYLVGAVDLCETPDEKKNNISIIRESGYIYLNAANSFLININFQINQYSDLFNIENNDGKFYYINYRDDIQFLNQYFTVGLVYIKRGENDFMPLPQWRFEESNNVDFFIPDKNIYSEFLIYI